MVEVGVVLWFAEDFVRLVVVVLAAVVVFAAVVAAVVAAAVELPVAFSASSSVKVLHYGL